MGKVGLLRHPLRHLLLGQVLATNIYSHLRVLLLPRAQFLERPQQPQHLHLDLHTPLHYHIHIHILQHQGRDPNLIINRNRNRKHSGRRAHCLPQSLI